MRYAMWHWFRSKLDEGALLPPWAMVVRAILFPLDTWFWRRAFKVGYQWDRDVWMIDGVAFSARSLRRLANGQGELYRVTTIGETVVLERVGGGMAQ